MIANKNLYATPPWLGLPDPVSEIEEDATSLFAALILSVEIAASPK
jgi:hypothetical protein